MAHRLRVQFATEDEFQAEFYSNIANGGIFVATASPPELRSRVEVVIELVYRDASLTLPGEAVHCVSVDLAATGASPGVAVHFDDSLAVIRETFAPYLDKPVSDGKDPRDARRAKRFPASVQARIRTMGPPEGESGDARTRDLSRYGALVAPYGEPTPIGESIKITITHPTSGEELEVDATVRRHETSESGEVTGLGVEFHLPESDSESDESARFLEDVARREHSRRLGAITGPIAELGISTLLNMFGTCSDCGTLTVTRDAEEGFVAFQGGMLRAARVGTIVGQQALAQMLAWRSGYFEFEASVDEERFEGEPVLLEQALLEVLNSQDEKRREKIQLRANTKLVVDTDAAEEAASELNQTDQAILELAGAGVPVGKIVEVIPETKRDVATALSNLVRRGVISPA